MRRWVPSTRVAQVGVLLVAGDGQNAVIDRERHILPPGTMRRPVFLDELRIARAAKSGQPNSSCRLDRAARARSPRSVAKGVVELGAKLLGRRRRR